jgi:hypothetical protein
MSNLDDLVSEFFDRDRIISKTKLNRKLLLFDQDEVFRRLLVELKDVVGREEEVPFVEFIIHRQVCKYISNKYFFASKYENPDEAFFDCIENFGVLTDEKLKYIDQNKKKSVMRIFFKIRDDEDRTKRVEKNLKKYWRHCYKELFEEKYKFAEFVPNLEFSKIGVRQGEFGKIRTTRKAMKFAIEDFGVLTEEKIEYMATLSRGKKKMVRDNFFNKDNEIGNLKVLINYICKDKEIILEEFKRYDMKIVGLCMGVEKRYTSEFISEFMENNFDYFGIVSQEKAQYLVGRVLEEGPDFESNLAFRRFLEEENPYREENYNNLILEIKKAKRKENLSYNDLNGLSTHLCKFDLNGSKAKKKAKKLMIEVKRLMRVLQKELLFKSN